MPLHSEEDSAIESDLMIGPWEAEFSILPLEDIAGAEGEDTDRDPFPLCESPLNISQPQTPVISKRSTLERLSHQKSAIVEVSWRVVL